MKYTNDELEKLVLKWAEERQILSKGDAKTQALKLVEEVGELSSSINKIKIELAKDAIGDCCVVLINLANILGTSLNECLNLSYNEIKERKGKIVDGNFIKEEDA